MCYNLKLKLSMIILTFGFGMVGCDKEFDPQPPIQHPGGAPTIDIFEDQLVELMNKQMSKFEEDKQNHYLLSKGLFNTVPVRSTTSTGVLLESVIKSFLHGYYKELQDRGVKNAVNWDAILTEIAKLDYQVSNDKLDQGDLFADWMGIGEASIQFTAFLLESNEQAGR